MSKPRILGYIKTYIPNNRRREPYGKWAKAASPAAGKKKKGK